MKKNIAVVMGGYSLEHDISIKSGDNVIKKIDKNRDLHSFPTRRSSDLKN